MEQGSSICFHAERFIFLQTAYPLLITSQNNITRGWVLKTLVDTAKASYFATALGRTELAWRWFSEQAHRIVINFWLSDGFWTSQCWMMESRLIEFGLPKRYCFGRNRTKCVWIQLIYTFGHQVSKYSGPCSKTSSRSWGIYSICVNLCPMSDVLYLWIKKAVIKIAL